MDENSMEDWRLHKDRQNEEYRNKGTMQVANLSDQITEYRNKWEHL